MSNLPISTLHELLDYDPNAGAFTWRERGREWFKTDGKHEHWNAMHAGQPALNAVKGNGYLGGKILGRTVFAHRVAWAYAKGEWPPDGIDHENHDKQDNRIDNLVAKTQSGNMRNRKRGSDNTSGVMGVWRLKTENKWHATIYAGGRTIHLGRFDNFDEAVTARKDAEWAYGFHENHNT